MDLGKWKKIRWKHQKNKLPKRLFTIKKKTSRKIRGRNENERKES